MRTDRFHQTCLKNELDERVKKNPRYSLRAFAESLEIDATALSKVMSGKKRLTPELGQKVLRGLDLNPQEADHFMRSLAEAYKEGEAKRMSPGVRKILAKRPCSAPVRDLSPEVFKVISDWYHYAILQLMEQEGFKSNYSWIARELGILHIEAKHAVERMLELGLITVQDGKLIRTAEKLRTGDMLVTTSALRKRIRQVSEKSLHSLENDPIHVRNHRTMTMAIDPDKLPLARQMIQEFMDQLGEALETKKKTVYELQINFFPLQKTKDSK